MKQVKVLGKSPLNRLPLNRLPQAKEGIKSNIWLFWNLIE